MSKYCQSCSMPLSKDPRSGGTQEDGSKSVDYCSYCYQNGRFTDGFTSANEMRRYVYAKLVDRGMAKFPAFLLSLKVPYLKRWRGKPWLR